MGLEALYGLPTRMKLAQRIGCSPSVAVPALVSTFTRPLRRSPRSVNCARRSAWALSGTRFSDRYRFGISRAAGSSATSHNVATTDGVPRRETRAPAR